MRQADIVIVGAGPAGLSAAVEAGRLGAQVVVVDENAKPGGQLFKQIHKFFGSREHLAGIRGFDIGQELLAQAQPCAQIKLNSTVYAIYPDKQVALIADGVRQETIRAKKVILAAGASENVLAFPGSTLPGVMSAGAVQTMMNVYQVLPAEELLMIGSGNVGLIVSYQIMQAGGKVNALLEAAPRIGGYGVHAAKISRAGVPILTRHTVQKVLGEEHVEGAIVVQLDDNVQPVPGSERMIACGAIAIAVGLTPLTELAHLAGCQLTFISRLGGMLPVHDDNMETTVPGIYAAGDLTGVEEASSAMEEGRLAGIAAAEALGYIDANAAAKSKAEVWERLHMLRSGNFGSYRRQMKEEVIEKGRIFHAI
ncbi:MAG: FAD-dependent pyridine nucleotide-disulfide oxidoreductase [Anaerosporomusa subterranea]|nr:FAD-dependent pyridine nucleotide-disulfide oxidoreductase [Anaerosporomusa subterranea]